MLGTRPTRNPTIAHVQIANNNMHPQNHISRIYLLAWLVLCSTVPAYCSELPIFYSAPASRGSIADDGWEVVAGRRRIESIDKSHESGYQKSGIGHYPGEMWERKREGREGGMGLVLGVPSRREAGEACLFFSSRHYHYRSYVRHIYCDGAWGMQEVFMQDESVCSDLFFSNEIPIRNLREHASIL